MIKYLTTALVSKFLFETDALQNFIIIIIIISHFNQYI